MTADEFNDEIDRLRGEMRKISKTLKEQVFALNILEWNIGELCHKAAVKGFKEGK